MIIEGRNPVFEAMRSDKKISKILVQSSSTASEKIREILALAQKKGVRVQKISRSKLDNLSRTANHQGVIAYSSLTIYKLDEVLDLLERIKRDPFFVIIPDVLYQQNLGAIIRSAECAGCSGVIIGTNIRILPEAGRTSMGAIEHIPIIRHNIFNAIRELRRNAIKVYAIEAEGKSDIYNTDLSGGIALVIGAEDKGVSSAIEKKCDDVIKIPLFGKLNSLNMSNAAAVVLFEKKRQYLENLNRT